MLLVNGCETTATQALPKKEVKEVKEVKKESIKKKAPAKK